MTVSYLSQIPTIKFRTLFRLLFQWKGSIYKIVWFEVILFGVLYCLISLTYRFGLHGHYKEIFEKFCLYCDSFSDVMPVAFILGFYVSMIAYRWWDQFYTIPWPDNIALLVNSYISGDDYTAVATKENIVRYLNISLLLFLRSVSPQVKRKFPEESSLLDNTLFSEAEFSLFSQVDGSHNRYYVPIIWAANLTKKAFLDGKIGTEIRLNSIIVEMTVFRDRLNRLFAYDWINPPLVYTQTATIAVYTYFVTSLFGRQFLDPSKGYLNHNVDFYVPVFSVMQLVFYFGWLKVAEALINPFGEDDDDFDCLGLIERNLSINFRRGSFGDAACPVLIDDVVCLKRGPRCTPASKVVPSFLIGSISKLNIA